MESKGRGSRSRGRSKQEMRQPDPASLEKLKQEQVQAAAGSQSPIVSEQMADPPDEGTADAAKIKEPDVAQELVQSPSTSQPADTAMTTTGEGVSPPLAEELKKAIRGGVAVSAPPHPSATITLSNKLNPSAPDFVPKSSSLDPRSSPFTPATLLPATSTSSPIFTKHSIPTSTSSSSSSRLNVASKEFVPSGIPPINPPPSLPVANGGPASLDDHEDLFDEDDGEYLSVKDLLRYEKAAPTAANDVSSEPVLKGAAEMLIKVFNYPGSFDEIGQMFKITLTNWPPTEPTLTNLAEMLVYWGIHMPDLRYAGCRMSEMIADIDTDNPQGIGATFSKAMLRRLQSWHAKCYDRKVLSDKDKYLFACYSGFFAEIFVKIRAGNKPVTVMYPFIFKYVQLLLEQREDFFIREACNILKLTGNTLVSVDGYDESKMATIIKMMNELMQDQTLSTTSMSLLMQVIELSGSKWCSSAAPVKPPMMSEVPGKKPGLNTNAIPFVPSDPVLLSEIFYDPPPIMQPPVSCPAEWEEFVGEDQALELGSNNSPDVIEEDYDGLDPEIELEMEAFIDEIEEHLMLQDFDPELHQNTKSDGKK